MLRPHQPSKIRVETRRLQKLDQQLTRGRVVTIADADDAEQPTIAGLLRDEP